MYSPDEVGGGGGGSSVGALYGLGGFGSR